MHVQLINVNILGFRTNGNYVEIHALRQLEITLKKFGWVIVRKQQLRYVW